ncbi:hypothetical protein CC80DRAFT_65172 [Byssothecium circinans]|uniref:Uncharacterized protein n=1 Tax=Byssothecium circinans TaxID=147558 RepID=A0A6A5TVT9_9PLEO|nr:hypothetical protein CC80DRAFT_65172 [Byssothecium circinans]
MQSLWSHRGRRKAVAVHISSLPPRRRGVTAHHCIAMGPSLARRAAPGQRQNAQGAQPDRFRWLLVAARRFCDKTIILLSFGPVQASATSPIKDA